MIKNALIVVLGGVGTLFLLVMTLFAAMTSPRPPYAVLFAYVVGIVVLGRRAQLRAGNDTPASPLLSLRRLTNRALLLSALGFIVALGASLIAARIPSQATLVAQFLEHRSDYEGLRDMAIKGGPSFSAGCQGEVDPAREPLATFERRLRAVGCPQVSMNADGSVSFALAAWGAANNGWRLSLLWTRTPPTPLIPSIDSFRKKSGGRSNWERAVSRIDGDWYLAIVW